MDKIENSSVLVSDNDNRETESLAETQSIHEAIEAENEKEAESSTQLTPEDGDASQRQQLDMIRSQVVNGGATRALAQEAEKITRRPVLKENGLSLESFTKHPSRTHQVRFAELLNELIQAED